MPEFYDNRRKVPMGTLHPPPTMTAVTLKHCIVPNSDVGDGVTCCLATLAWPSYSFSLGCAPRIVIMLLDRKGVYRATQRGVIGRSAADVWH